jgi:flagellar hook-associated protein 1 FlgK
LDAGAARQIEGLRNGIAASVAVVVTATANTIATWQSSNEANETLEKSLMDQKEAISGVNLDEEAANLVKYQQLYNASSKLLQAGRQMFDTLLSMLTVN